MCLPDFERFEKIKKENAVIGYRSWLLELDNPEFLKSVNQEFYWKNPVGNHKVTNKNSGLYSYNHYNYYNNHNNNNNNYYYDYYYYYNYYYYNYYISGIIKQ